MLDELILAASEGLPPFNHQLHQYREDQINGCTRFMEQAFVEATKLVEGVKFLGSRELTPEERLAMMGVPKKSIPIDIGVNELKCVSFEFQHESTKFSVPLFLPYLRDNAIVINGAKYYVQFALTDRSFYHIIKDDGLGLKVLITHLQFWRNISHTFISHRGNTYTNQVITTKIHQRSHRYTKQDIRTALLLYPLSMLGWNETLDLFSIPRDQVTFVNTIDPTDDVYEYFDLRVSIPGLYLKVHPDLLNDVDVVTGTKMRVVTSVLYLCQYFDRYPTTMFTDNSALVNFLTSSTDLTVWKVILGKSIFGIDEGERKAASHAVQHLESMATYLDPRTKMKLSLDDVHVETIMDLLKYVFENIDNYVVQHTPSDLSYKKVNILDLLLSNVVNRLFTKVFQYTNHRKAVPSKDIPKIMRIPAKSFTGFHNSGAIVAINPSRYNDNALITVMAGKKRTTHSAGSRGAKTSGPNIHSPEHRYHPTWSVVESGTTISTTAPDIAGDINCLACNIDHNGNIVIPDFAVPFIQDMMEFIITS